MKNTNTPAIDLNKLRSIETSSLSASWGGGPARLRLSTVFQSTEELGISWPSSVSDTIDAASHAIALGQSITKPGRAPLTWEDISGPDALKRINHAAMQDNLKTLIIGPALTEVTQAAYRRVTETIIAATPELLAKVAELAKTHKDDRDLTLIAAKLPANLRAKVSRWANISTAYTILLQITEHRAFDKIERNSSAFTLHSWTTEQWTALHESEDTLAEHRTVDWMPWAIENGITIDPAKSVEELAARTKAANDAAENYNRKHRPKRSY